jgi:hypothetical protein
MITTLAHRAPVGCPEPVEGRSRRVRPVIVQINIDISMLFWPLYALLWLGWLALVNAGRFIRRLWEIVRAVVVVSGRRLGRWLRGNLRRLEWAISGLLWGPVLGVG